MKPESTTITIPLSDFVNSHLGRGLNEFGQPMHMWHCRPIPQHIAEIIYALTKNQFLCCVQWADKNSPELIEPMLWDYGAWVSATEKWAAEKVRSDRERLERHMLEANIRIVARAFAALTGVEDEHAAITARRMLVTNNLKGIKALGVSKLITKESEL